METEQIKKFEKDFKKELAELLEKYNAKIGFTCSECSDVFGLSDDHLIAEIKIGSESFTTDLSSGWWIDFDYLK